MTLHRGPAAVKVVATAAIGIVLSACGTGGSPAPSGSASATPSVAPSVAEGRHPPACLDAELFFEPALGGLTMANCVDQMDLASVEQLWSWDGAAWELIDDNGPDAMVVTGMAWDGERQALVRYGGLPLDSNDCTDETWEWDDSGWAQIDAVAPPPCDHMKLAFDAAMGATLLFGGQDAGGTTSAETWAWDGASWRRVATEGPPFRAHFELVYEDAHGHTLLWGGYDGNRVFDDFWSWDGAAWAELAFPGLSARSHASMVVTPGGLMLFGGATSTLTYASLTDETWLLTNDRWSRLDGPAPSPRGMAAFAYDAERNVVVLYGGFDADGGALADTWEWDGAWHCVEGCP